MLWPLLTLVWHTFYQRGLLQSLLPECMQGLVCSEKGQGLHACFVLPSAG
jgi:hypothetical protein